MKIKLIARFWGGTLGFVAGAAFAAWLGKVLGYWPPSENFLIK